MRLGQLACRVIPKASVTINSPFTGLVHVNVDRPQTNLPAEFVWGTFEPKLLKAEQTALEEAKRRLDEKEHLSLTLELPKQMLKVAKDMEESQKQVALLEMLTTNRALAPALVGLFPLKDRSASEESLKAARKELQLLKETYRYLQETNLAVLGVDLQVARTELQRRELDFERQQNQSTLKMPFASQLNISFQLAERVFDYPVNSGQELAVLRDLSAIFLRAILSDPSWSTLPTDKLKAVINLPNGTRLEAPFAFKRLEKVQMREDIAYYFQFPTNRTDAAARMMGTDVSCELILILPEPARVIPKLTLVMNLPASAFQNRRWDEGVKQLDPRAKVLVEGQSDLAIAIPRSAPKDESDDK